MARAWVVGAGRVGCPARGATSIEQPSPTGEAESERAQSDAMREG